VKTARRSSEIERRLGTQQEDSRNKPTDEMNINNWGGKPTGKNQHLLVKHWAASTP